MPQALQALPVRDARLDGELVVLDGNQRLNETLTVTMDDVDRIKGTGSRLAIGSRLSRADRTPLGLWFWEIDRVLLLLVSMLIATGLVAVAAASPVADRIRFVGRVPHHEVELYYSVVDVLAYPRKAMRLTELVTPLKPLEAMAQGKLVVASDVGGHRELIEDGVTGTLFAPDDPAALAHDAHGYLRSQLVARRFAGAKDEAGSRAGNAVLFPTLAPPACFNNLNQPRTVQVAGARADKP